MDSQNHTQSGPYSQEPERNDNHLNNSNAFENNGRPADQVLPSHLARDATGNVDLKEVSPEEAAKYYKHESEETQLNDKSYNNNGNGNEFNTEGNIPRRDQFQDKSEIVNDSGNDYEQGFEKKQSTTLSPINHDEPLTGLEDRENSKPYSGGDLNDDDHDRRPNEGPKQPTTDPIIETQPGRQPDMVNQQPLETTEKNTETVAANDTNTTTTATNNSAKAKRQSTAKEEKTVCFCF